MLSKPGTSIAAGVFALVVAGLLTAGSKGWAEQGERGLELVVTIVALVLAVGGLVAVGLGLRLALRR